MIAKSAMTDDFRRKITVYDAETDTVSLLPGMYGQVAQISRQEISGRGFSLHFRFE